MTETITFIGGTLDGARQVMQPPYKELYRHVAPLIKKVEVYLWSEERHAYVFSHFDTGWDPLHPTKSQ